MTHKPHPIRIPRPAFVVLAYALIQTVLAQPAWPPAPPLPIPDERDPGLLPSSVMAEPLGGGQWNCKFQFKPETSARTVSLASTFNGWNRDALLMNGPDGLGQWSATALLHAGTHEYKFVVNGEQWFADPLNASKADDGQGGANSVLKLGKLAHWTSSPAKLGDGQVEILGLRHDNCAPAYFQQTAADKAVLRIRTLTHDVGKIEAVVLDGETVPMTLASAGDLLSFYEAEITLPRVATADGSLAAPSIVQYTFVLTDGDLRVTDFPAMYKRGLSSEPAFQTPEWAKHAVWYQIMVDRFRNGSSSNDPAPVRPWTSEWFTMSSWETEGGQTFYKSSVFHRLYGGDLQGVADKLPYLKDLGINAIYFNPLFKAKSHHKYDATNFVHIDDHFGFKGDYDPVAAKEDLLDPSTWQWTETDKLFLHFLTEAHGLGIRVIIDGVFNHVGTDHPAFQDVQKNGKQSRFADWFDIVSWDPFKYQGWAGHDSLPVFKKRANGLASESCKSHIFAVTRRWMDPNGDGDPSDGVDGWRLDVPNEIAMPFWAEWRTLVKSINPEAYVTGEIWDRAEAWLDGKHFDAVMNYPFSRAAVAWIFNRKMKIGPSKIDSRLAELRLAYPPAATYVMQNLMGSHDTDRVASMAQNPDREYDHRNRAQDDNPQYDNAKPLAESYARARLATLLQMTYVGAPMIYYGDEVGMWGADDPTCRKPMLWEDLQPYEAAEVNHVVTENLDFTKRAIALRNAHPALRTGSIQTLVADDTLDVWVFIRADKNERLIVALNASDSARDIRVPMPQGTIGAGAVLFGPAQPAISNPNATDFLLTVPPISGVVIKVQ